MRSFSLYLSFSHSVSLRFFSRFAEAAWKPSILDGEGVVISGNRVKKEANNHGEQKKGEEKYKREIEGERSGEIRKEKEVAEHGAGRKEGRKGRLPELFGLGSRAVTRFVARLEPDGSEVDANAGRISSRLYPARAPYTYVYTCLCLHVYISRILSCSRTRR